MKDHAEQLHVQPRRRALVWHGLTRWLVAAALAASWLSACAEDDPTLPFEDRILISYEAIPSAQLDTWGDADPSAAPYEARAELTRQAYQSLWPDIAAAVGVDIAQVETLEVPGGYMLITNPALQSALPSEDVDREDVDRLAAALGYVLRQWDILITDFAHSPGNTGYAVVELPALTPQQAQAFFEHAAATDSGLGGGYTAFGNTMLFLNLRDTGTDMPYSGLEDDDFIAALERAAGSFTAADAAVVDAGERAVDAWFVSNDWDTAAEGQDFAGRLVMQEVQALDALRAEHDRLVSEWLADLSMATETLAAPRISRSWAGAPHTLRQPAR